MSRVMMSPRYAIDDILWLPGGLQVTVGVTEADDAVAIRNVDPFRVGSRRIEGDAEGLTESTRIHLAVGGCRGSRWDAVHTDGVGKTLGNEQVAVGRDVHRTRVGKTRRYHLSGKAFRNQRPRAGGHGSDCCGRIGRSRDRRQVF